MSDSSLFRQCAVGTAEQPATSLAGAPNSASDILCSSPRDVADGSQNNSTPVVKWHKSAKREQRITASLAALNAPQPTNLTLAQWKEIVEEIEDED